MGYTIAKANVTVTAPTANDSLTYSGSAQALVTAGSVMKGTMYYAVGTDASTAPSDNLFTTEIPERSDAKTYYVWYKVVGDENHNDTKALLLGSIAIAKGKSIANAPEATMSDVVYTNKKVGDVTLPTGWIWADTDKNTELTVGTPLTAKAIYTAEDKDSYEDACKSVNVSLTRNECKHPNLSEHKTEAVSKTCITDGNSAYYTCPDCGKYFSDAQGTTEIKKDSWIINKTEPETPVEQKPTEATPSTTQTPTVVEKGEEVTVEKKGTFKVTSDATLKTNTVTYTAVANTKAKSVTIPDTVTVDGKKYEVTEVSAEVLKNSSATTVTIGKNVTTLAPEAFKGSSVKTITIKSKKLTKKSVKNAFKGLKVKKLIVKVKVGSKKENKKYIKKYKKFFTKKNIGVKAVVK